ncbi:MAG: GNAT family N-acetyltransferase [Chitinophagales bacterium]|nr:GNAT family N-acetyltransferase [Chitinophagaceae bacterium]MCB9064518.1 GNAT family N-acetyltransferase [Chitinophagales bacterium]
MLKEITPELYIHVFENSTDEEIKAYFDFDGKGFELAKSRYKKGMTNYHTTFKYFLLKDKETQSTIGTCGYYRWYEEHNRAEFGYVMSNMAYRKQGLMTEAANALIPYAFDNMGVHRIEAFASPENEPSIRILEGLGFTKEGLMRDHFLRDGVYEPSAAYSLLKHEFDQMR